ncbi:hypothetical protein [Oceanirhabdus sp. W0125-5]|uniref:hypothetical protein n=1 Tax=Oceanirhabdus sp. W0125-5 TaxID=2999116 RepID=UPI0022F3189C|nr:hypothetical protein [Oceanirhabdus sp. W0125-5]WBW96276.1 hypothetical protein OW730_21665 [Oceanirhabdus sp. W0125-5]
MDQFEKEIKIIVDLHSEESIKNALDEYIELFESGKVGEDKQIGDVEFVKKEGNEIKTLLLGDCPTKEEVIEYYMFVRLINDKEDAVQQLEEMKDYYQNTYSPIYFSEALVFSNACNYPNLKEKVVKACEMIANYSKKKNDTWSLWVDDEYLAGIDALYFLAKKDPTYIYLIAEYIIPYWDDEHAQFTIEEYIKKLFELYGMRKEFIKAFVVSDNSYARGNMFSDFRYLKEHFEKNPDDYSYFKELTIEKYVKEESLMTEYGVSRIKELYTDILGIYCEDDLPEYWNNEYEAVCKEIDEKRN